jgi:hypothetical protein
MPTGSCEEDIEDGAYTLLRYHTVNGWDGIFGVIINENLYIGHRVKQLKDYQLLRKKSRYDTGYAH